MKIAIIGSKGVPAKYGGVQTVVEHVAVGLAELGHDITIYGRQYYAKPMPQKYVYKNVNVINVKGINSKRLDTLSHSFVASLMACFKNYDIVAYHSVVPAYFAVIPKLFGKKTVLHSHGLIENSSKWSKNDGYWANKLARISAFFIDKVTTVSIAEVSKTSYLYSKRATVIPNGIEYTRVERSAQPSNYILYVGRIVPGKGVELLVKAYNDFCQDNKLNEFELYIIGLPVHASEYYRSVLELSKMNNRIKWLGLIHGKELIEYYRHAYCVVIPSEYESFGLTVLEALEYNGCVLCSAIEQFKLLFSDYVLYFEKNNPSSLRIQLIRILNEKDLRKKLVNKSIEFDFCKYSWDRVIQDYQKFYHSLLNK